jgi:hypothetical protein
MEDIKTIEYRIERMPRPRLNCEPVPAIWETSAYSDPAPDNEGSISDLNLQVRRIKRLQSRSNIFDYRLVAVIHMERVIPVKFNPFA